jgi:hypothetical protein
VLQAAVRASYLDGDGEGVRFYHETLLEYFAGVELARDVTPAQVAAVLKPLHPTPTNVAPDPVGSITLIYGTREENVLKCAAGIVTQPQAFVGLLVQDHPHLAAECIMSGAAVAVRQSLLPCPVQQRGSKRVLPGRRDNALPRVAVGDRLAGKQTAAAAALRAADQPVDRVKLVSVLLIRKRKSNLVGGERACLQWRDWYECAKLSQN